MTWLTHLLNPCPLAPVPAAERVFVCSHSKEWLKPEYEAQALDVNGHPVSGAWASAYELLAEQLLANHDLGIAQWQGQK